MTTTVDKAIKIAKAEVGYREGYSNGHWNNKEKYANQVPGLEWVDDMSGAWCAVFMSWVYLEAGLPKDAYCTTASVAAARDWAKKNGRFSEYPAIGAMALFGTNGSEHTGLVYAYDADYIYTVEGNTNADGSAEGNGVYLKTRERKSSRTYGYLYPKFPEGIKSADPAWKDKAPKPEPARPKPQPAPRPVKDIVHLANLKYGKTNADVKRVQKALIDKGYKIPAGATGYYGDQTTKAYAAWQKHLGYKGKDADGIPGIKSLVALGFDVQS